jgi:ribosomal protein L24
VNEIERTRNETHTVIADLVQAMTKHQHQQQQQQQQQQHGSTAQAATVNTANVDSSSSNGYIQLQQKCDALQQQLNVSDKLGSVHAVVEAHELIGG